MCKISGMRPVGRVRRRLKDNIERDIRDLGLERLCTEWATDRIEW